jgi:hypothetical protein
MSDDNVKRNWLLILPLLFRTHPLRAQQPVRHLGQRRRLSPHLRQVTANRSSPLANSSNESGNQSETLARKTAKSSTAKNRHANRAKNRATNVKVANQTAAVGTEAAEALQREEGAEDVAEVAAEGVAEVEAEAAQKAFSAARRCARSPSYFHWRAHSRPATHSTLTHSSVHTHLSDKFVPTPAPASLSSVLAHFDKFLRLLHIKEFFGQTADKDTDTPRYHLPPLASRAILASASQLVPAAVRAFERTQRRLRIPSSWSPHVPPSFDLHTYGRLTRNTITRAYQSLTKSCTRMRNVAPQAVSAISRFVRSGLGIITLADKNAGTVAVSADWYRNEAMRQLSDTSTYKPVAVDFAQSQLRSALATLNLMSAPLEQINKKERQFILLYSAEAGSPLPLPYFYLLIKLHKSPVVGRPIVSWHSFCLGNASIWVDSQLQPLLRLEPSILDSSNSFVRDIAVARADQRQCWLLSADVASLYTVMPVEAVITALRWFLHRHVKAGNFSSKRVDVLLRIVRILMSNAFLIFGDQAFQQLLGLPMGTHCGPSVANVLLLHVLDLPLLAKFGDKISFLRRFIDDLFLRCADMATAVAVSRWLNTVRPWLRFSVAIDDSRIEFMDLLVYKAPGFASHGRLDTAIHFKPVSRHLYLPFSSYHPRHTFSGIVVGELIRAAKLCSQPSTFVSFRDQLHGWLRLRGYPPWFLAKWFGRVQWSKRAEYGVKSRHRGPPPLTFNVPYDTATSRLLWRDLITQSWQLIKSAPCFSSPPIISWSVARRMGAIWATTP